MNLLNVLKKTMGGEPITDEDTDLYVDATGAQSLSFQVLITDVAAVTGSIVLQKSLDAITWFDDGDSQDISGNGDFYLSASVPLDANYYWPKITVDLGELTATIHALGKGFV